MTRFARAKGSKASNERVPNEATPWHVMKEQLEDNVAKKNSSTGKVAKNAKTLLSEKDQPYYYESTGNVNNEWAEFRKEKKSIAKSKTSAAITNPVENGKIIAETTNSTVNRDKSEMVPKSKKIKQKSAANENDKNLVVPMDTTVEKSKSVDVSNSKKKKRKLELPNDSPIESNKKAANSCQKNPKKQKSNNVAESTTKDAPLKEKAKDVSSGVSNTNTCELPKSDHETTSMLKKDKETEVNEQHVSPGKSLKISKRHKRNQKRISKNALLNSEAASKETENGPSGGFNAAGNDWSIHVKFGKSVNEQREPTNGYSIPKNSKNFLKNRVNGNSGAKRKAPKIRDDKEHKRRKPESGSTKCVINGIEVEIVKYDGFPVKKEDAERLKELRQQMTMKGIPKSEIDVAMKLERRKAEKSLARVRKQVCFHCRKAGHNLSDCPELGQEESATGICFKCGSTEHTHFECKVNKKEEFRFASCFICREQGHIAKQCPDNPKGLYPQGGSCKICGDVTHLKKDCPDLTREKEETNITVGSIAQNTLESLDDDVTTKVAASENSKKLKSKIVKF
ncbi:neurofilament heavy polypeptide-like [Venturia canescens]|uniref:neurofilament heavy polypeptide-like n=1 Tax=Venturia canescens TaxID=32260 RepID=UPI001C9CAD9B|nr:neurofilament heavy polypeptide-like [Venturia canescens]